MSNREAKKQRKQLVTQRKKREWISGYAFISLWLIGTLVFFVYTLIF